jgi:hypothetical protein
VVGLAVLIGVIMLLIHADRGRRSLLQLLETDYLSALVAVVDLKAPLATDDAGAFTARSCLRRHKDRLKQWSFRDRKKLAAVSNMCFCACALSDESWVSGMRLRSGLRICRRSTGSIR